VPGASLSSRYARALRTAASGAVLLLALVAGCGGGGDGGAGSQEDQLAAGSDVYAEACAKCHGDEGQGGTGPVVIGGSRRIAAYETTTRVYDYISRTMPFDNPGSLSEDEYWNVIAYLLDENSLLPAETVLGPDSDPVELKR
jgi:mono/diheme cytochrome c family protein